MFQMFAPLRLYVLGMALLPTEPQGGAGGAAAAGFVLLGPFELGATLSAETQLFGYHRAGAAAHAGLRVPIERFDLELDAAATLGGAAVRMGPGLLSDDPGAGGSIGFVGGRGGVGLQVFRSGSGNVQLSLSAAFSYEHDLARYTVHYTYAQRDGWFGAGEEIGIANGSKRIGMDRAALMLGVGLGVN